MLKRQESSLSASRRQAAITAAGTTPPPPETHHAKAIGCMSGIIQLFSKYQNPKKRLTFGRKQQKTKLPSPTRTNASVPSKNSQSSVEEEKTEKHTNFDTNRLTCAIKVPRSPTLPPEIRRSNTASSPENSRTPSSLVARLMGLEDIGAAAKRPGFQEDPITEKRQRLLQALEKCNEDLEALKRIIKAVQTADVRLQPPHPPASKRGHSGDGNAGSLAVKPCMKKCTDTVAEEPNIPAEELTRSPLSSYSLVQNTTSGTMRLPLQRKPTAAKKPGEDDEPIAKLLISKSTIIESSLAMRRRAAEAAASPPWSSRAMVQSVEEVCNDIAWGEKREIERIGLVVQDYLCRELIEELVEELKSCPIMHSLPLEACKRRLCF